MCAADHTSGASTLTGTLDDGNGSVAIIGSLPKCLAALCAMNDIPSGGQATIVTGSLFWNLIVPIVWTITRPLTSHLPPCLVDPIASLSVTLRH